MEALSPFPPFVDGRWSQTTVVPMCDHCFCRNVTSEDIQFDWKGILRTAEDGHMICCKCGDVRHKKFVNGGTESDHT